MHVLEMKGAPSGKKQKIYCQIVVKGSELNKTTAKQKLEILFWGEIFNFTPESVQYPRCVVVVVVVRVCLFSQLSRVEPFEKVEVKIFKEGESKKKKKDSGNVFLGSVELPVSDITGDWHEDWYPLLNKSKLCEDVCTLRVRAVYQTVDVLDQRCYTELLDFLKDDSLLLYKVVEEAILLKEKVTFIINETMYLYKPIICCILGRFLHVSHSSVALL